MAFIAGANADREYLFIDGGCLRNAVKKVCADVFGDAEAYTPFIPGLAEGIFQKVFYYDAVPGKQHGESQAAYEVRVQPDHERFSLIQGLDRVHVALGKIVGKDKRQKGVDVRLAVDMMTQAFRGNISRATLFAGDADFEPLVRALVAEGMHVTLWHPPQAPSELKGAADTTRPFNFQANHHCFSKDGVLPAFRILGSASGGISPEMDNLTNLIAVENSHFAARWAAGKLTVWQRFQSSSWSRQEFEAPGSTLHQALVAYGQIVGTDLARFEEGWVHTE